jgi:glycosyltransferase involved in cell wall biosynthesis
VRPAEQTGRRRILFLLPFAPRRDATHGGGRVLAGLIAELALRQRVALVYLRAAEEPPLDPLLQERCEWVEEVQRPSLGRSFGQRWWRHARLLNPLLRGRPAWVTDSSVGGFAQRLRARAQSWMPEIIQVEYQVMAQYLPALDHCPAPRILTVYEPAAATAQQLIELHRGLAQMYYLLDALAWQRFESQAMTQVQTLVVFTERDRRTLEMTAKGLPITCIAPNIELRACPLDALGQAPSSLVFVGNFGHPPNQDAAERLTRGIFPLVLARLPQTWLTIVGPEPPMALIAQGGGHVTITGVVPDTTPYLNRAALVVVPLRIGGGIRVKVLEALGAGKAVVASPLAAEGLDVVDGQHIVLAETDRQFCDAILGLLADPERRRSLATCARVWAEERFGWPTRIAAYEQLYERLT